MTNNLNLVTPDEAAKKVFVTRGMISYWIRRGRVKKHYVLENTYHYLVDLDEVISASKFRDSLKEKNPNLVSPSEAAKIAYVSPGTIRYYAKRGYIQKFRVYENEKFYMVDKNEVLDALENADQRSRKLLSNYAIKNDYIKNIRRDRTGKFVSKSV